MLLLEGICMAKLRFSALFFFSPRQFLIAAFRLPPLLMSNQRRSLILVFLNSQIRFEEAFTTLHSFIHIKYFSEDSIRIVDKLFFCVLRLTNGVVGSLEGF